MSAVYRYRDLIAAAPSLALAAVLVAVGFKEATSLKPKYDEPVKIELIDPADVPPPPPEPLPPQPQQVQPQLPDRPQQPTPQPTPETPAPEQPRTEPPAPQPQPAPQPLPEAPPPRPPEPAPAPRPAPSSAAVEGAYVSKLRAYLDQVKRYPTGKEASLQRPEGKVEVWLLVARDGRVLESGIEKSSDNMLLNEAAKSSLRRITKVEAIPENAWQGEASHRFTATFNFIPPTQE
jgi:protein TonB